MRQARGKAVGLRVATEMLIWFYPTLNRSTLLVLPGSDVQPALGCYVQLQAQLSNRRAVLQSQD